MPDKLTKNFPCHFLNSGKPVNTKEILFDVWKICPGDKTR